VEQEDQEESQIQKEQKETGDTAEEPELEEITEETSEKEEEPAETEAESIEEEKPALPEEEAKRPAREKEAEKEEEIVEEKIYTVPLSRAWIMPARKRTPRAMRILRSFITKHMKLETRKEGEEKEDEEEPAQLIISDEVNRKVWARGAEKPPRKIRVRAAKDKEGNVTVYLAEGD
jgi:large subunit ribosomal protein L31e